MAISLKAAPIAEVITEELRHECSHLAERGIIPNLKVILVGEHPPSVIYTRNKKKFMENIGAKCEIIKLEESISEAEFLSELEMQCNDNEVNGLFVQLPLPNHLSHIDVGQLVSPEKDVDGFHAENLYGILSGDCGSKYLIPCTPRGILTMLDHANVDLSGKNVVVIGRSLIVGKPMALLLTNKNATVTICHSRTKNIKEITSKADVIIVAIGKERYLNRSFLNSNKNQILIDVGINHDTNGKICGDIDYEDVVNECHLITPVPGGVGKMTILSLGQNLIAATKRQCEEK